MEDRPGERIEGRGHRRRTYVEHTRPEKVYDRSLSEKSAFRRDAGTNEIRDTGNSVLVTLLEVEKP